MANPIAADYGFTKAVSGAETTFIIKESLKNRFRMVIFHAVYFAIAWLVYAYNESLIYGVLTFLAFRYGFKALGTLLGAQTKPKPIVISPTTISIGKRTYSLKDVRNWHIGNKYDEQSVLLSPGQAVLRDLHASEGYYIAFDYGGRQVTAAWELTSAKARALATEIMATLGLTPRSDQSVGVGP